MTKSYKRILVISDMHFPYAHPDTVSFLSAIKKKYSPDKVVSVGDEIDGHSLSFHEHDPDLMSPSDELQTAINRMKPLYKLFPRVDLAESNHGSLVYRRAKYAGLPSRALKSYRDVIEAPKGWVWHEDMTLKMSNGQEVFICHNRSSNFLQSSQRMGMCFVAGHFHGQFEIRYWGNPSALNWSMAVGCLIDKDSLAFSYGRVSLSRPIIGCGIILDGLPRLLPMILGKNGRWNKMVP